MRSSEHIRSSGFEHDLVLRLIKIINILVMTAVFTIIWTEFYGPRLYIEVFYRRGYWVIAALFAFLFYNFGRTYDTFHISYDRKTEMVYSHGLALLISDFIMFIVTWLLTRHFPLLWPIFAIFFIQMTAATIWCIVAQRWYFHRFSARKTLIIYDMREGMEDLISEYGMNKKFNVQGTLHVKEVVDNLSLLDDYEVVFFCGIHSHDRNMILKQCIEKRITGFVIPRIGDVIMSGSQQMHMLHLPVLRIDRYKANPEFAIVKRIFDIALSGLLLIVLSPIMLAVSILVKKDKGPAFYKQVRLTKDGKEFKVLKFRSMRVDAEKDGVARLSTGDNDDRITPVGKIIRKVRLDELPQLINIFLGDMSFVGPRPERPEIAAQYEKELPEFRLRLQAKAGLTGYAQVYGKYNTTPYDKLMMDLMYIAHPGIIQDMRILFATVKILFLPESTEGVAVGQTTAMKGKNETMV